ncbi:MAG: hypothetical protein L6Q26_05560 [Anaerolineales bacterium]|nr:hypothetical protein [Anaerolineales bacterium]NUQ85776.1 hypothetical protein [Anaerolineales bacterium]
MAFEMALKPPFFLPRLLRAHRDEPQQEYHWLGKTREKPQKEIRSKEPGKKPGGEKNEQGYRPLANIQLGEVEEALALFEGQLLPSHASHENWIGKNHFCTIPLKRIRDGRPPVIFGRVKTCYPSDGYLDNVEDIELLFPRRSLAPDLVYLRRDDVSLYSRKSAQSFFLRVRFKVSEEEAADFKGSTSLFARYGFHPEFDSGFHDILEMNDLNQSECPRLFIVGSRWLDSIPESVYVEVKIILERMLHWNKRIVNYHPGWLPKEINTLNRTLGLKYKLTRHYLTESEDPKQTADLTAVEFDEMFAQGLIG